MRKTTLTGAIVAVGIAASPAVANAATTTTFLDSHAATQTSSFVGPVTDAQTMTAGKPYSVTIAGIVSVYSKANWANPRFTVVGTKGVKPSFPSPGIDNTGPTGQDAGAVFSYITTGTPVAVPKPAGNLEVSSNGGASYAHLTGTKAAGSSLYTYRVIGAGFPLKARFYDPSAKDNYGQFRIRVTPLAK